MTPLSTNEVISTLLATVGSFDVDNLIAAVAIAAIGWVIFFGYFLSGASRHSRWRVVGVRQRAVLLWSWFWTAGAIAVFGGWWGFFAWRVANGFILVPTMPNAPLAGILAYGMLAGAVLLAVGWMPRALLPRNFGPPAPTEGADREPDIETVSADDDTPYQPLYPELSFEQINQPPVAAEAAEIEAEPEPEPEPDAAGPRGGRFVLAAAVALIVVVAGAFAFTVMRPVPDESARASSTANFAERLSARIGDLFAGFFADSGGPVIPDEALEFHTLAANARGAIRAADFSIDLERWRELAQRGDAGAQYKLGVLYANGRGAPQDFVEAYKWLNIAGAAGDEKAVAGREAVTRRMSPAQIAEGQRLARVAISGGDVLNFDEIPARLQKMSERELVREAQALLNARGYDVGAPDGISGPRTRAAVRAFQRQGGLRATGEISHELVLRLGDSGSIRQPAVAKLGADVALPAPRTPAPAIPAVVRAAPTMACDRLAAHPGYDSRTPAVAGVAFERIDAARAIGACEEAVKKFPGEPRFQFQLARSLHKAKRYEEALALYGKSGEQGFALAQRSIGFMYANGNGVAQNLTEAVRWLRQAADRCDVDAQFALATLYESGRGIDRDPSAAAQWFERAAAQGHDEASARLRARTGVARSNSAADRTRFDPADDTVSRHINQLLVAQESDVAAAFDQGNYADVVAQVRPRAEQGDAAAQTLLGYLHQYGLGVGRDASAAADWYRKAADQGHANAQYLLGYMYHRGVGVLRDLGQALRWYRTAAEQGVTAARVNLGVMYRQGEGVDQDLEEAVAQFFSAAEAGLAGAQHSLAEAYEAGAGVPRDLDEALKWYRLAAEQGFAPAQNKLGKLYSEGRGVTADYAAAANWFRLAADQGLPDAHFNLAEMMSRGRGAPRDAAAALDHYALAAERGHAESQLALALAHLNGNGVEQNYAAAANWFTESARQCNVDAQFHLAQMHRLGQIVPQSSASEELKWLTLAAEQGHAAALNLLSSRYAAGVGVAKDPAKARSSIEQAARQGNASAQFKLAEIFADGNESAAPDYEQAAVWYRLAAEQGIAGAQVKLAGLYREGLGVPRSYVEALSWYRQAADQGEVSAQHSVGVAYRLGAGIAQDQESAVRWFRLAAERGYAPAQRDLGFQYLRGAGVLQSFVDALFWFGLAAAQGDADAAAARDRLAAQVTPEQISEAEDLAAKFAAQQS